MFTRSQLCLSSPFPLHFFLSYVFFVSRQAYFLRNLHPVARSVAFSAALWAESADDDGDDGDVEEDSWLSEEGSSSSHNRGEKQRQRQEQLKEKRGVAFSTSFLEPRSTFLSQTLRLRCSADPLAGSPFYASAEEEKKNFFPLVGAEIEEDNSLEELERYDFRIFIFLSFFLLFIFIFLRFLSFSFFSFFPFSFFLSYLPLIVSFYV